MVVAAHKQKVQRLPLRMHRGDHERPIRTGERLLPVQAHDNHRVLPAFVLLRRQFLGQRSRFNHLWGHLQTGRVFSEPRQRTHQGSLEGSAWFAFGGSDKAHQAWWKFWHQEADSTAWSGIWTEPSENHFNIKKNDWIEADLQVCQYRPRKAHRLPLRDRVQQMAGEESSFRANLHPRGATSIHQTLRGHFQGLCKVEKPQQGQVPNLLPLNRHQLEVV